MIERQYGCIVADPPWHTFAGREIGDYVRAPDGSQPFGVRGQSTRKLAYSTMTLEQIARCVPPAADQAHLYLWTTNGWLRQAFDVVEAWGFRYSTTLVWAKNPIGGGLGGAYGLATEFCLFCRRGSRIPEGRIGRNWWNWRRPYDERGKPKHSAKPQEFYEMAESMSPTPRLEMFARVKREGWDAWGDEVDSNVTLAG
jgi:N6-adenosine-specific RNA methylase IME4